MSRSLLNGALFPSFPLSPFLVLLLPLGATGARAEPTRILVGSAATLATPIPTRPMEDRRFDFELPAQGLVELAWEAAPGALFYQLQVAVGGDFSALANESQQLVLGEPATRVELVGPPAGAYSWRVAAIDDQGRRGPWSRIRRFSVNEGPPPAEGEGPELEIGSAVPLGSKVLVRGTATTEGRVEAWVNGVPSGEVPVGEGGEFSVMLDANQIGRNLVRLVAMDKRGQTTIRQTSFYFSGH